MTLMGRPGRVWDWGERPLTERACGSRTSRGRTQGCASRPWQRRVVLMQYPLERKKQQFLKFSTTNRSVLAAGRENSLRLFTCWRNTTRVPSHQQGELYSSTSSGIHSHSLSVKGLSPQSQTARASHQRHARWFSPSWNTSNSKKRPGDTKVFFFSVQIVSCRKEGFS